jgi:hypothetical protein
MNIKQWIALAKLRPDEPLPPELHEALTKAAEEVYQLALSSRLAPDKASAQAAKAAGLTAGAIDVFRQEQTEIFATMSTEFNIHQPGRGKVEFIEEKVAASFNIDPRTLRRWRKRVMDT